MASSASTFLSLPNPHTNDAVFTSRNRFNLSLSLSLSLSHSTFKSKSTPISFSASAATRPEPARSPITNPTSASKTFDVIIVGAGIIGLTIARQFLTGSELSVAVVDKAVPCSGATGAGQGYIWMAHKSPSSELWELALRSQKLWEELAEILVLRGLDPLEELGWKKTGSMLVGRSGEELEVLRRRVEEQCGAGIRAEYLSGGDLRVKEPELRVDETTGAAFLPDDAQLDAHRAVEFLEKGNRLYSSEGRYAEFYNDPVLGLLRSGGRKEVDAIKTSRTMLHCRKAVVMAAGCWSGSLMHELIRETEVVLDVPVKPRKIQVVIDVSLIRDTKGHLLVLENFNSFQLNHGLMEVGYVNHQTTVPLPNVLAPRLLDQTLSVSMTATMDTVGNIVLGSSRQFAGFSTEVEETIINRIWDRAGDFFPKLKENPLSDFSKSREVRVGLRPYMPDGKPVIGAVPGLPNLFLATGHEGGGLSMALGTAEMLVDMVLGNDENINSAPFAPHGRC